MRITAAAAEGRASTVERKCGKQSWEDTLGLERGAIDVHEQERDGTGDFGGSS